MSKHTPAPWIFNQEEMKIKGSGDYEGMTVIANVSPKMDYSRGMGTQCANAKLIAAAPELLEACVIALRYFNGIDTESQSEAAFHALNNAIKKATS